jgi:hypothetical protein
MASRVLHYERVGDPVKVIKLQLRPPPTLTQQQQNDLIAAGLNAQVAAGTIPGAPGTNFWTNASTTEKVVIVAGGVGAAALLYSSLRPRRRR